MNMYTSQQVWRCWRTRCVNIVEVNTSDDADDIILSQRHRHGYDVTPADQHTCCSRL